MKPWNESNAAFQPAKAGDAGALHRSFHAAYAQVMRPVPNQGEDARAIANNLDSILVAVGDRAFADALQKEKPLTRSAVRDCMVEGDISRHYPQTSQIFEQAPPSEWPSDEAEAHSTSAEQNREIAPAKSENDSQ